MSTNNLTYSGSGVNYDNMDPFKISAQIAARVTARMLERFGFSEIEWSRGESAYLIDCIDFIIAIVEEGLGTKNRVANAMHKLTGKVYDAAVSKDTIAMIVNDMITLGALPMVVAMHLAVGDSAWFNDKERSEAIIKGWKEACIEAGCTWGPGETPTLKQIIYPGEAVMSGSAVGIIKNRNKMITPRIADGDAMMFFESSGIHANGLTLAQLIATRKDPFFRKLLHLFFPKQFPLQELTHGYLTKLSNGESYGEALLKPTHLYVKFIEDCMNTGIDIHYLVNITGHGWRKLMRARETFTYVVEELPTQLPIFAFIEEHGPVTKKESYGNLNKGVGFAMYIPQSDVSKVLELAKTTSTPYRVYKAGFISKSDTKKVIIKPEGIEFSEKELQVR